MPSSDNAFPEFEDDRMAWRLLRANGYHEERGMIFHPDGKKPSGAEWRAILYLHHEWDYEWKDVNNVR